MSSSTSEGNNSSDGCNEEEENSFPAVKPNIESKLNPEKRRECRDIVTEIRNFGVNQRQILFLIQLLSLELENREVMQKLLGVIGECREEIPVESSIVIPSSVITTSRGDSGSGIE